LSSAVTAQVTLIGLTIVPPLASMVKPAVCPSRTLAGPVTVKAMASSSLMSIS